MSWIQNIISLRLLIYSIFEVSIGSLHCPFLSVLLVILMSLPYVGSFLQMSGHPWLSLCTQERGAREWFGGSVCWGWLPPGGLHAGWWLGSKLPFPWGNPHVVFSERLFSLSGWWGLGRSSGWWGSDGLGCPKAQRLKYQVLLHIIYPWSIF